MPWFSLSYYDEEIIDESKNLCRSCPNAVLSRIRPILDKDSAVWMSVSFIKHISGFIHTTSSSSSSLLNLLLLISSCPSIVMSLALTLFKCIFKFLHEFLSGDVGPDLNSLKQSVVYLMNIMAISQALFTLGLVKSLKTSSVSIMHL